MKKVIGGQILKVEKQTRKILFSSADPYVPPHCAPTLCGTRSLTCWCAPHARWVHKTSMKNNGNVRKRLSFAALGIITIWVGVSFIREGWSYHYRIPVPEFAGYVWVAFGFVLIIYGVLYKGDTKD